MVSTAVKKRTISLLYVTDGEVPDIAAALLERLFDQTSNVAFFTKDAEGRYVAVNQPLLQRYGIQTKVEAIGNRPGGICAVEFGRISSERDAEVQRTGRPLVNHLEM